MHSIYLLSISYQPLIIYSNNLVVNMTVCCQPICQLCVGVHRVDTCACITVLLVPGAVQNTVASGII